MVVHGPEIDFMNTEAAQFLHLSSYPRKFNKINIIKPIYDTKISWKCSVFTQNYSYFVTKSKLSKFPTKKGF